VNLIALPIVGQASTGANLSTRRRANPIATRIAFALVCAGALAGGAWMYFSAPRPPERLILIVIDTLRRDHVSAYGGATPTPHIDALAARGQLFTNLLASFHQTTMSMAALFTGRTPSLESGDPTRSLTWSGSTWCGLLRFAEDEDDLCIPRSVPTLAERLRDAGYWTIGIASNQFLFEPSGFGRGFDDWSEVGDRAPPGRVGWVPLENPSPSRYWKETQKAVNNALDRRRDDRFLLYVHYMDVHDYGAGPEAYARGVRVADAAVGHLLKGLEGQKLLDDAVVFLVADHGERLGERHALRGTPGHYGNPSFQEVLEVPLIIAPPVFEDPDRPLRSQDLHGLILEAAGVTPPAATASVDRELFIGERRYRTYVHGPFKSVVRREDDEHFLFDLRTDPGETRNLSQRRGKLAAAHRERIEVLGRELAAGETRTARPLSDEDRARLELLGYVE
jgi:arylsulfatase A-like enzyme